MLLYELPKLPQLTALPPQVSPLVSRSLEPFLKCQGHTGFYRQFSRLQAAWSGLACGRAESEPLPGWSHRTWHGPPGLSQAWDAAGSQRWESAGAPTSLLWRCPRWRSVSGGGPQSGFGAKAWWARLPGWRGGLTLELVSGSRSKKIVQWAYSAVLCSEAVVFCWTVAQSFSALVLRGSHLGLIWSGTMSGELKVHLKYLSQYKRFLKWECFRI